MASPRGAVHVIRCLATGEVYVGSTCNLTERWAAHRARLRAGTHVNEQLQAAWDAYGEAAGDFGDEDDEPAQSGIYGDVRTLIGPSGERIYAQWMSVDARIVRRANTTPPA
jgi:hypothetical protein